MTVSIPHIYHALKKEIMNNMINGKYLLGDLIEPKLYRKIVFDGGVIVENINYRILLHFR